MKKLFAFILSLAIAFGGFVGKSEIKAFFSRIFAARTVQAVAPKVMKAAPRAASGAAATAERGVMTQAGRLAAGIGAGVVAEEAYRAWTNEGDIVTDAQAAEPQEPVAKHSRSVRLANPDKL